MSQKKLNILFLSSWYPSLAISNLGNFVQHHAEAVATLNEVHVLYVTFLDELKGKLRIEQSVINSVTTTIVYCHKGISSISSKRNAFKEGIRYLTERNQFRFDIVHQNIIWNSGWQSRYLHRKFDLPYIITEHWTGYDTNMRNDQPYLLRLFSKYVAKKSLMICPVTQNLATVMQEFGLEGNYQVIPNVVDTTIFHLEKKEDEITRFLHVSSLEDSHKNISGILRVWKKISDQNPHAHLTLGGDGPYEDYQKQSTLLGIRENSISFFGEKKWNEIAEMMQKSHCLILFSNYENLPCVIVEALASGMVVISTNVGGISEHIDETRGYLVPKGDEDQLAEAIKDFLLHRKKFIPTQLQKYAEEQFSIKSIAKKYDDVYRRVLSGHIKK